MALRLASGLMAALMALIGTTVGTQDAVANGDTRTLSFFHTHSRENLTVTFRRNGRMDDTALDQLNWFLRDWRTNETTKMDPRLFDVLWEVYQESGSRQPINIVSSYRSPTTNGMLHRRSSGVAEHSQHMLGKAMDIRLPDVDSARLRAIAMKMQYGGVGYYSSSNFVHVDTGNVRAWPRMTQDQLVRLFPDGKTLHLPPSGKPLSGYEEARAEILPRNAALAAGASPTGGWSSGSLLAGLFGRKTPAPAPQPEPEPQPLVTKPVVVAAAEPEAAVVLPVTPPPVPPRRPLIESVITASAAPDIMLPPRRPAPVTVAQAQPAPVAVPDGSIWSDAKTATPALFDARTALLNFTFTLASSDDLSTTRFTGPAVKPLPVIRQMQASL